MLALRATRRIPALSKASRRLYATSSKEGSVAQSKEFSKKEKAHEDMYVRQHEEAQLRKLREKIQQTKQEVAELEKEHAELEKGIKKE